MITSLLILQSLLWFLGMSVSQNTKVFETTLMGPDQLIQKTDSRSLFANKSKANYNNLLAGLSLYFCPKLFFFDLR